MAVMPIRWKLKEYLAAHNITPYRLMKESGLAQGTVYRIVNGEARGVDTATLDAALTALRSLTGKPVGVQDLLEYEEKGR
jgi:DNA-binding Xre family transcriptional regulator